MILLLFNMIFPFREWLFAELYKRILFFTTPDAGFFTRKIKRFEKVKQILTQFENSLIADYIIRIANGGSINAERQNPKQ
ncbi:MAG: hypothetical protein IJS14_04305 [Lentisphaeria bacterium]|nr:hypothetical protein [Lentisphaeria bacterium]